MLYCSYDDLVSDPTAQLERVLEFMTGEQANRELLQLVLDSVPISARTNLEEFEFFDAEYFAHIETLAASGMKLANLLPYSESY